MSTIPMGSLYPGRAGSTQEQRNVGGGAKVPTRGEFEVPIMSGLAAWAGVSVYALLLLGVMAWWLIEAFD